MQNWTVWNGLAGTTTLPAGPARRMPPWFKTIFPASAVVTSAFLTFNGMCGMSSWIGATNGLPTRGTRIWRRFRNCRKIGGVGPTRWPCGENFIFYHYKRGGAKTGYCTLLRKEVPISGHPYHNKEGRCTRCRHPVVFKALGRAGYFQTDKYYAYLIQRCKDGFVIRNSGRTGPTERTGCHTASLIGMSSGVRFMTTAARSVPITGECTASGKHGGSQEPLLLLLCWRSGRPGVRENFAHLEKNELRHTRLGRVDTQPSGHRPRKISGGLETASPDGADLESWTSPAGSGVASVSAIMCGNWCCIRTSRD